MKGSGGIVNGGGGWGLPGDGSDGWNVAVGNLGPGAVRDIWEEASTRSASPWGNSTFGDPCASSKKNGK
jgi:hypothetical protein